jgi:hypothetical protein
MCLPLSDDTGVEAKSYEPETEGNDITVRAAGVDKSPLGSTTGGTVTK